MLQGSLGFLVAHVLFENTVKQDAGRLLASVKIIANVCAHIVGVGLTRLSDGALLVICVPSSSPPIQDHLLLLIAST